ncbi:HAMP domain-containing protein [Cohnella nanjingensis]|uniref:histidine kinase n=2 Tax=Cohnella nanjingensis TaxID=1387779 RepID=A0A7X0RXH3_9BACL|nr:HAMP domain-containing protein [Cohnella nanjingensis]
MTPPKLTDAQYEEALKRAGAVNRKKEETDYHIAKDDQGREQLVVLRPLGAAGRAQGLVQISTGTASLKDALNKQLLLFVCLAVLALAAGLITLLAVLRRTLSPLSELVDRVERIDAGNLDERFPATPIPSEIGRLSASLGGMLDRLNSSFEAEKEAKEQMRQFVADASHELRTPLTSIHGFLEVLLRGASSRPEQLEKALRSMYGESERLKKLVEDLLALAKLDRAESLKASEGELSETVREMEPQLRMLAGNRQVDFQLQHGLRCRYDAYKIKQVILNLFHNAVQHTDAATGSIKLSLDRAEGGVRLAVSDNGTGIEAVHLPHVFDRFYRSDSSRTRKYGGSGLGLSISRAIAEAHGGTIEARSEPGRETVFTIILPF